MESVYIHIPFCSHICSYCDFCKILHLEKFTDAYLDSLHQEILDTYDGERIKTLYIGGGTPSCLNKKERTKLIRILSIFKLDPDVEYTFECNPADIDDDLLDDLVALGVNRISIGVQSFDKDNLKFLERDVDYNDLEEKIAKIRDRGIDNINLDLMYALPNEKLATVKKDLTKLLSLKPTHISTYSLIIEEHTKINNEGVKNIDPDLDRKMYDSIIKVLEKNNFHHYEVSNFALPGYESKHNLNYWNNGEYYGFGLGASGFKDGFRYTNTKNLDEYMDGKIRIEENLLTYQDQMDNEIMLGFRKTEGINIDDFYEKYGTNIQDVYPKVKELLASKDLVYKNGFLYIPKDKLYVMNEILVNIL